MAYRFNPFTGTLDITGSQAPAVSAPKLLIQFSTDVGTIVGNLLVVNGANTVTKISDNFSATIPNGIFGVAYTKPDTVTVNVMFNGIIGGYSGFTVGQAIYIHTDGTPTHLVPSTGIVQQIGFAVSSTEFFVQLLQPINRG